MPNNRAASPAVVIEQMLDRQTTYDLDGNERKITGGISRPQANFIREIIKTRKLCRCVETGVAYGVSTLAICQALSELEKDGLSCRHWGVDPCQFSEHNGVAIAALRRSGLAHLFELMEGPSHTMLPKLLEHDETVDLVFVDGWHTFDYTLLDVFYADKLLRPGGILIMHDMQMPSKQKVWNYLRTHREYRLLKAPMRPWFRRVLSCSKNTILRGPRMGLYNLTKPLMLVAEKSSDYEPSYDFYHSF